MSREIDRSDLSSLSPEDVVYLAARGQLTREQLTELNIDDEKLQKVLEGKEIPFDERVNTGDASVRTAEQEALRAKEADKAIEAEQEAGKGFQDPKGGIVGDELPDDLNELSTEELRAELKSRDLAVSGNKAELVDRLQTAAAEED